MVREKSGNLRKREKSGNLTVGPDVKVNHSSVST